MGTQPGADEPQAPPFDAYASDAELAALRVSCQYIERVAGCCARAAGHGMPRKEALTLANHYLDTSQRLRNVLHAAEVDRQEHGE